MSKFHDFYSIFDKMYVKVDIFDPVVKSLNLLLRPCHCRHHEHTIWVEGIGYSQVLESNL